MKEIYKALIKAQSEFPAMIKNADAHNYAYLDLASLIEKVNPVLEKNGLGFTQLLGNGEENGNPAVKTIVFHAESGETIESVLSAPAVKLRGCNDIQGSGATYSYLRRYALQAILGLASEDNDASDDPKVGKSKVTNDTEEIF